jgi:hypothetical protein
MKAFCIVALLLAAATSLPRAQEPFPGEDSVLQSMVAPAKRSAKANKKPRSAPQPKRKNLRRGPARKAPSSAVIKIFPVKRRAGGGAAVPLTPVAPFNP